MRKFCHSQCVRVSVTASVDGVRWLATVPFARTHTHTEGHHTVKCEWQTITHRFLAIRWLRSPVKSDRRRRRRIVCVVRERKWGKNVKGETYTHFCVCWFSFILEFGILLQFWFLRFASREQCFHFDWTSDWWLCGEVWCRSRVYNESDVKLCNVDCMHIIACAQERAQFAGVISRRAKCTNCWYVAISVIQWQKWNNIYPHTCCQQTETNYCTD